MLTAKGTRDAELAMERNISLHEDRGFKQYAQGTAHDGSESFGYPYDFPCPFPVPGSRFVSGCTDGRGFYDGTGGCRNSALPYLFYIVKY